MSRTQVPFLKNPQAFSLSPVLRLPVLKELFHKANPEVFSQQFTERGVKKNLRKTQICGVFA